MMRKFKKLVFALVALSWLSLPIFGILSLLGIVTIVNFKISFMIAGFFMLCFVILNLYELGEFD